jgi:hypothetical protein
VSIELSRKVVLGSNICYLNIYTTPTPIHLHPYEILNYFVFIKKIFFRLITAMHLNGPLPQVLYLDRRQQRKGLSGAQIIFFFLSFNYFANILLYSVTVYAATAS